MHDRPASNGPSGRRAERVSEGPCLSEIKAMLQANVEALARQLAPDGRRSGRWWVARNPRREDNNPSFGIGLYGAAPGAWKDFATGEKGDVIGLIQYVHGLDMRTSLDWARAWLGIDGAAPVAVEKKLKEAKADAAKRAAEEAERAAKNRRAAKAIYLAARKQPFAPSIAHSYLLARGIDVLALPRVPGCLGWLPRELHVETQSRWSVMIAAFTGDDGQVAAIHKTFLWTDMRSASRPVVTKAPVSPVRKIWPGFKGAAIRLWRGGSGLSIDDALRAGLLETLVLAEGVEDGLSVALACPELRVWAAGSLSNLAEIAIPACCDDVVVCADNDWGKPQAQALLNRAIAAIAAQGARVRIARSTIGKDVNDALLGGA